LEDVDRGNHDAGLLADLADEFRDGAGRVAKRVHHVVDVYAVIGKHLAVDVAQSCGQSLGLLESVLDHAKPPEHACRDSG
jgi:hypothetical protein